jgi:hypothetical protein
MVVQRNGGRLWTTTLATLLAARAWEATELLPIDAEWRYHQGTNFNGIAWVDSDYDDSAWSSGPTPFYNDLNFQIHPTHIDKLCEGLSHTAPTRMLPVSWTDGPSNGVCRS